MRTIAVINFLLFVFLISGCQKVAEKPDSTKEKIGVQREIFNAEKYPELTSIGRINFKGRKHCSLALVAEDIAITAGHCFLEEHHLSDMTRDLDPGSTTVIFRVEGFRRIENISIKRVLKAKMKPDYAIVRLNKKIAVDDLKPLKFDKLTLEKMRLREENLGCAGFNGDKKLGDGGFTMTISRNIKITPETSSGDRIDTNCISTHGGSGGAFFEKRPNPETTEDEYFLLGVIWGVTDDNFNEKGDLVEETKSVTSITPVSVFYDELTEIIEKN